MSLVRQLTRSGVNGLCSQWNLKFLLKKRLAYNVDELVRVAKSDWRKFLISKIRSVFVSRRERVKLMETKRSFQFEQVL